MGAHIYLTNHSFTSLLLLRTFCLWMTIKMRKMKRNKKKRMKWLVTIGEI